MHMLYVTVLNYVERYGWIDNHICKHIQPYAAIKPFENMGNHLQVGLRFTVLFDQNINQYIKQMDWFFFLRIFLGLSPSSFPAFRTSEACSHPDYQVYWTWLLIDVHL